MTARIYVTCTPGLEDVLLNELSSLHYQATIGQGGVEIRNVTLKDAIFLNIHLRTASRVLLKLIEIESPTKAKLYNAVYNYDWAPFFKTMPTLAIETPLVDHPEFTNSMYVAQVTKDAICDHLRRAVGSRPSVDKTNPQIQFHVVITEEKAILYFDTSLEPLFKRGYRLENTEAPLKETLAAAILMLAGYSEDSILLDPCAGSGTFLIEAGLMASKCAPGLLRSSYGFMLHPEYNSDDFTDIRCKAQAQIVTPPKGSLTGFEYDGTAYRKSLRCIAKSELMGSIEMIREDFRRGKVRTAPNLIVTNPPFGVRLGSPEQWMTLYSALGDLMKQVTKKPARGAVLTSSPELSHSIRLKPTKKIPIWHGGLNCTLLIFDLY
jgi:putative N6-adenine-specific DNA methylase